MSRPDAIAEALREVAGELDDQRVLLVEILKECRKMSDNLGAHEHKTLDGIDRLGTRTLRLETRVAAIEKVVR